MIRIQPRFVAGLFLACLFIAAEYARATAAAPAADWRNFANGHLIPDENYCDQPRVVVTSDGAWVCILTTGPGLEGKEGEHIVATTSLNKGMTWSPLVDVEPVDPKKSAYAVALLTPADRVYAIYNYNGDGISALPNGKPIRDDMGGWFCFRFSDDRGKTWSKRYRIPVRLTAVDRNNEWQGKLQMFWAIGTPAFFGHSAIFGFTKLARYILVDGEGWYVRSDNILSERDPEKLDWQVLPDGDHGLRKDEFGSVQEEHDVVSLEGDDLFTVWRTTNGFPICSYSRDGGHTWETPEPMRYSPGGRGIKQPRACTKIWKTSNNRYLLWFHNNGTHSYSTGVNTGSRNIAWLSAGALKNGRIYWSQPEIAMYVDGGLQGCSYPDLIEDGGKFYLCSTEKDEARVSEVDPACLADLWRQDELRTVATTGLKLRLTGKAARTNEVPAPRLPLLSGVIRGWQHPSGGRGGVTIEALVRFADLKPDQVLLDNRDESGKGFVLKTTERQALRFEMCDGWQAAFWESDPGLLKSGTDQHVVVTVDGGPKTICFMANGQLCDGGKERMWGYGRFYASFIDLNGRERLQLAPSLNGELKLLRIYTRALRTSEALGNFRATCKP